MSRDGGTTWARHEFAAVNCIDPQVAPRPAREQNAANTDVGTGFPAHVGSLIFAEGRLHLSQVVVSAAGGVVLVAFRTSTTAVSAKKKPLTLAAPPPVRLVRRLDIVQQGVFPLPV